VKKIGTRSDERHSSRTSSLRPPVRREVLLYVEDDDDNWRVAQLRLSEGYELIRARNAAEACRALEYRGTELSAILMDIELRGSDLDGVQLTQLVRGKAPRGTLPAYARGVSALNTPIIFVTAHGAKYGDTQLILAGGDKVISKPIDFGALNLAITQLHLSRMGIKRK
jgi:CheY-like chemotaxis protein